MDVLCNNNNSYPNKALCPVCKKKKVFEPHEFVVLSGGCMKRTGKQSASMAEEEYEGFLNFHYHNDDDDIHAISTMADEVKFGQFQIYTCSVQCMRTLLNKFLDDIEKDVKRAKKKALKYGR